MCKWPRTRCFSTTTRLARECCRPSARKRIAVQIEPDGRQPLELARTKAWSYSVGNLAGLMTLARLGEHVDVDLWHFKPRRPQHSRGARFSRCRTASAEQKWPYEQINGFRAGAVLSAAAPGGREVPGRPLSRAGVEASAAGPNKPRQMAVFADRPHPPIAPALASAQ